MHVSNLLYLLYLFAYESKINIYSKIYSKFPLLDKILVSFMLLYLENSEGTQSKCK